MNFHHNPSITFSKILVTNQFIRFSFFLVFLPSFYLSFSSIFLFNVDNSVPSSVCQKHSNKWSQPKTTSQETWVPVCSSDTWHCTGEWPGGCARDSTGGTGGCESGTGHSPSGRSCCREKPGSKCWSVRAL